MLHVSRPIRWDSDHVVILNDDVQDLAREIVRCDALDRVHIGLIISTLPSIVSVLMSLVAVLRKKPLCSLCWSRSPCFCQYEDEGKYFQRLALQEEAKSLPWGGGLGICIVYKVRAP